MSCLTTSTAFIIVLVRTPLDKNGTELLLLPTTEEQWDSFLCMILLVKNLLMLSRIGKNCSSDGLGFSISKVDSILQKDLNLIPGPIDTEAAAMGTSSQENKHRVATLPSHILHYVTSG